METKLFNSNFFKVENIWFEKYIFDFGCRIFLNQKIKKQNLF